MIRGGTIKVRVKLFTGLDKDAGLGGYHRENGLVMEVSQGVRLRKVIKTLGLPDMNSLAYFVDGERVGLRKKLEDGNEVACLKPSTGG